MTMESADAPRWLAAAALAAALALPALAQETRPPAEPEKPPAAAPDALAPVATFPEFAYDFGEVSRGQKVKHSFVVRNDGKVDLEVLNVAPT
jgi:nucleoid-associated protein YgaU